MSSPAALFEAGAIDRAIPCAEPRFKWCERYRQVLRREYPAGVQLPIIQDMIAELCRPAPAPSIPTISAYCMYLGLRRPKPQPTIESRKRPSRAGADQKPTASSAGRSERKCLGCSKMFDRTSRYLFQCKLCRSRSEAFIA